MHQTAGPYLRAVIALIWRDNLLGFGISKADSDDILYCRACPEWIQDIVSATGESIDSVADRLYGPYPTAININDMGLLWDRPPAWYLLDNGLFHLAVSLQAWVISSSLDAEVLTGAGWHIKKIHGIVTREYQDYLSKLRKKSSESGV